MASRCRDKALLVDTVAQLQAEQAQVADDTLAQRAANQQLRVQVCTAIVCVSGGPSTCTGMSGWFPPGLLILTASSRTRGRSSFHYNVYPQVEDLSRTVRTLRRLHSIRWSDLEDMAAAVKVRTDEYLVQGVVLHCSCSGSPPLFASDRTCVFLLAGRRLDCLQSLSPSGA